MPLQKKKSKSLLFFVGKNICGSNIRKTFDSVILRPFFLVYQSYYGPEMEQKLFTAGSVKVEHKKLSVVKERLEIHKIKFSDFESECCSEERISDDSLSHTYYLFDERILNFKNKISAVATEKPFCNDGQSELKLFITDIFQEYTDILITTLKVTTTIAWSVAFWDPKFFKSDSMISFRPLLYFNWTYFIHCFQNNEPSLLEWPGAWRYVWKFDDHFPAE